MGWKNLRSEWISRDYFNLLLTALMPENRLALQVSAATGLRIDDVLSLRTNDIQRQRVTVKESKTGKARRVYFPKELWEAMHKISGRFFVFEGRTNCRKHRTRQAVYKDLRRVAAVYRIDGARLTAHVSPHTARKIYAVEAFHESGNLACVQEKLNHSDPNVTMLYAMADVLTARAHKPRKRS